MEKIDVDSPTHKVYHLVLEDYLDYLDSKIWYPTGWKRRVHGSISTWKKA